MGFMIMPAESSCILLYSLNYGITLIIGQRVGQGAAGIGARPVLPGQHRIRIGYAHHQVPAAVYMDICTAFLLGCGGGLMIPLNT
jgi:hypothetical protein